MVKKAEAKIKVPARTAPTRPAATKATKTTKAAKKPARRGKPKFAKPKSGNPKTSNPWSPAEIEDAFVKSVMFEDNALRQFRACQIGTPEALQGQELAEADAQISHPKVTAKMWHFYLMKARAEGIIP